MKKQEMFFSYQTFIGEELKSKLKKGNWVIIDAALEAINPDNPNYKPVRQLTDAECNKFIDDYHTSEIARLKPSLQIIGQSPTGSIIYNGHDLKHGITSDFYLFN